MGLHKEMNAINILLTMLRAHIGAPPRSAWENQVKEDWGGED